MLRFSSVHNSLTMRYVLNKARSPNPTRTTVKRVLQKRKKSTSVTIPDANCNPVLTAPSGRSSFCFSFQRTIETGRGPWNLQGNVSHAMHVLCNCVNDARMHIEKNITQIDEACLSMTIEKWSGNKGVAKSGFPYTSTWKMNSSLWGLPPKWQVRR